MYQIDKDGMVTETAPIMPVQTTLGWLGGLASAMSGVKVDQYQQHLQEKGNSCTGAIRCTLRARHVTAPSLTHSLLLKRMCRRGAPREGEGDGDDDELAMISTGFVKKKDLATVIAIDGQEFNGARTACSKYQRNRAARSLEHASVCRWI